MTGGSLHRRGCAPRDAIGQAGAVGLLLLTLVCAPAVAARVDVGAIESVLTAVHTKVASADTPAEVVEGMKQIDTTDCPSDFRAAYYRYYMAWDAAAQFVEELPSEWHEIYAFSLYELVEGNLDLGLGRLRATQRALKEDLRETRMALELAAIGYGAALPWETRSGDRSEVSDDHATSESPKDL